MQLNQDVLRKVDSADLQGHHSLQKRVQLLVTTHTTPVSTVTETTHETAPSSRENYSGYTKDSERKPGTELGTNSRESPSKGTHLELLSTAVSHYSSSAASETIV